MPKVVTSLTDTQIKNAKPKTNKEICDMRGVELKKGINPNELADYQLSDGKGLYLLVTSIGSKLWRFNYVSPIDKKRRAVNFGAYPEISLTKARALREEARQKVKGGIDISLERQDTKLTKTLNKDGQLHKVIDKYLKKIKDSIGQDTYEHTARRFERDILPFFATYEANSNCLFKDVTSSRNIKDITHQDLLTDLTHPSISAIPNKPFD